MARICVFVCAFVLVLLLVAPCTGARSLRGDVHEGRLLSEENFKSEKRSMKSGDDAVPTAAKLADYESKYNEWVRFQAEQMTQDYPPAAANPSDPCCAP